MDSREALEEIERIQNEFGICKMQLPAELEAWWYDITRIEFDPEAQAIRLVSDR